MLLQRYFQKIQRMVSASADGAIAGAVIFALTLYQAAGGIAVGGGIGFLAELTVQAGEGDARCTEAGLLKCS
jgi:hypothetical protein